MRNCCIIIEKIIKEIPTNKKDFIADLKFNYKAASYTVPEDNAKWLSLQTTVNKHIINPTACKIDKIESGMRDGLKELNNMLAEANCLSEYPSIPTEYKEDLQSLVSFPAILKSALVQCRHKQSDYPTPAQLLQFFE